MLQIAFIAIAIAIAIRVHVVVVHVAVVAISEIILRILQYQFVRQERDAAVGNNSQQRHSQSVVIAPKSFRSKYLFRSTRQRRRPGRSTVHHPTAQNLVGIGQQTRGHFRQSRRYQ